MTPYKNVHTDTLSIGRIKMKPGEERVFDSQMTEKEANTVKYFVEKGYLIVMEPLVQPEVSVTEEQPVTKKRGRRSNAHSE